ncbi:DUF1616 domain-containing protein [Haloarcula litorea]|uniref:DUF1616 domain-containing protein n=1 Tax=Haloarcula litorea TaxID=3032579 RepID=UPI0023E83951|nr:DUF1616 domain-containing protein [Halomicroarcula sp. GDY20]
MDQLDTGGGNRTVVWDLVLVGCLVVATNVAVLVPGVRATALRTVLGVPFLVLLPGYALVSALFPRRNAETPMAEAGKTIDSAERIGFAVGLSVATVGLVGLALSWVGIGVGLLPMLLAVSVVALAALFVAAVRRYRCRSDRRFVPRLPRSRAPSGPSVSGRTNALLNVAVGLAVVVAGVGIALGTTGLAVNGTTVSGLDGERDYTELSVLAENGSGAVTAESYPKTLTRGESESLIVTVGNHERDRTTYTAVVRLQQLGADGETVVARQNLGRFRTTLAVGEEVRQSVRFVPSLAGEDLRLVVLLDRGSADAVSLDTAYRAVHIDVTVTSG